MSRLFSQCMCGATDCPSCGPAQGYRVIRVWDAKARRYRWINPDDDDEAPEADDDDFDPPEPDDYAADAAADRYERDIDARHN